MPRNTNSRRVMEVLDIREEGVALRYLEINGAWEDHIRYAITAEEWQARARRARPRTWSARSRYSLAMRKACAFALRSVVRRFHIFIFQWRLVSAACAGLRLSGVVMVRRHPGPAWLVHLIWFITGTDLRCNGVEFAVDAMPLVVSVGSCIHLRRRNRLLTAMALAHEVPPLSGRNVRCGATRV